MKKLPGIFCVSLLFVTAACVTEPQNQRVGSQPPASVSPKPSPETAATESAPGTAVTFPVLDAFFASGDSFVKELQAKLQLTEEQIEKLRATARDETAKLREDSNGEYGGSTAAAQQLASQRIEEIVGAEKAVRLFDLVRERWRTGDDTEGEGSNPTETISTVPNSVPKDTRVVVNIPGYRMDVFDNGQLVKSYKIGIGYPEFPLPTGLRTARAIIFNPTWTPPDEPWVESPNSKVKVGQKVEAGSRLNPLGLLKIPIGSPSLIHGGKSVAKLGTFASHGCVGLTDVLAQDFAKVLAQVSGSKLSDADIATFKKTRSETKQVNLAEPVPVELRYETIVAEDGKLHIFRDVYDQNTNTEENLRAVLAANGVSFAELSEEERTQLLAALEEMSRDAKGKASSSPSASPSPKAKSTTSRVTRSVKGKKEIVIEVAALKGKGYPVASTGLGATKSKT